MEKLYSCRRCALCCLLVLFVILSTEAESGGGRVRYIGPPSVEAGEGFEVECRVSEFEPIKWTLNGTRVPENCTWSQQLVGPGEVSAVLRVAESRAEHSGEYRCSSFFGPGHQLVVRGVSKVQLNYDFGTYKVFDYRGSLVLQCNLTLDAADGTAAVSWLKEGKPVMVADKIKTDVKGFTHTLTVSLATDSDAGNYTCVAKEKDATATEVRGEITAVLKPLVKLPPHTSVVEGEKLVITCSVFGVPVPNIYWIVGNKTYSKTVNPVKLLNSKEKNITNAVLQIDEATMDDRETYTCVAETQLGSNLFNATSETFVRVKDKMAALWPFLGICLEVVVLCTVILVYEKKRNKTEMDESDTDGSPEQKNTPDHGKDSDVRHRK